MKSDATKRYISEPSRKYLWWDPVGDEPHSENRIDAIDEAAKAHGLTRSAFLASAAREKIEGRAGSRGMHTDTLSTRKPSGRHTNKRRA